MKHLLMASLATILIVFTVVFLVTAIDSIGGPYADLLIPLVIAGVAAFVSSIVVLFWAIPVHFLLRKINKNYLGWYIAAAVLPSFSFVYVLKPFGRDSNLQLLQQALFCSFAGSLAAVGFWYFAVYRQRTLTHQNGSF